MKRERKTGRGKGRRGDVSSEEKVNLFCCCCSESSTKKEKKSGSAWFITHSERPSSITVCRPHLHSQNPKPQVISCGKRGLKGA